MILSQKVRKFISIWVSKLDLSQPMTHLFFLFLQCLIGFVLSSRNTEGCNPRFFHGLITSSLIIQKTKLCPLELSALGYLPRSIVLLPSDKEFKQAAVQRFVSNGVAECGLKWSSVCTRPARSRLPSSGAWFLLNSGLWA